MRATASEEIRYLRALRMQAWNRQLLSRLLNCVSLIEGKKGKGKTLSAVAIGYNMREEFGRPVVVVASKMGLSESFGDYTFLDERSFINELDKVAKISKETPEDVVADAVQSALESLGVSIVNSIIIFDEAYKLFDSRTPSDKLVRVFGYFVAQSRHYNITILLLTPDRGMVDRRVRRQVDWFGRCTTTCRSIPDPETNEPVCIRPRCPHRTVLRFRGGAERFRLHFFGPNYWHMFQTYALVGFRQSHLRIEQI